jgi:hypothetical protein
LQSDHLLIIVVFNQDFSAPENFKVNKMKTRFQAGFFFHH